MCPNGSRFCLEIFFFVCVWISLDLQCNLTTVRFRPALPLSFLLVVTFDESHEMPAWTRNAVMATAIYKIAAESTHGTYGDMDAWTKGEKVQALLPLSLLPPHVAHPRPGASL